MKINGIEIGELDIYDADTMEKCEAALKKVQDDVAEITQSKVNSAADAIRMQCKSVFDCFNSVFGEGTDKKIFGNKTNLRVCLKSFAELVDNIGEQKKDLENLTKKFTGNRATRRVKNK